MHLNCWTEQADRWIDLAAWDACAGPLSAQLLDDCGRSASGEAKVPDGDDVIREARHEQPLKTLRGSAVVKGAPMAPDYLLSKVTDHAP
jgi:hypothetical protein